MTLIGMLGMSTKTEKELRQEWQTPDDFWQVVFREFYFDLDVAATAQNAKTERYIGPNDLGRVWAEYNWCNPGFSNFMPWMERAVEEAQARNTTVVMALISPSTKWWHWTVTENRADEVRLLRPRVQFVAPPGIKQSSNAHENCLVVFRRKPVEKPTTIWTWNWKGSNA